MFNFYLQKNRLVHWSDDKEVYQKKKIKNNKIEKWTYEITRPIFFFLTFKLLVNFSSEKKNILVNLLKAIYYP